MMLATHGNGQGVRLLFIESSNQRPVLRDVSHSLNKVRCKAPVYGNWQSMAHVV